MSNNLWNAILAGALFGAAHGMTVPVMADHARGHIKGFKTMDSLGCLIVGECTDNVRRIKSISDITREYPDDDFGAVADEFNSIIKAFNRIGVGVFLADSKYFPVGHRGVYHTVSNNFYLNDAYMHRQSVLMSVTRHEGWHAAQDCMAGTIDNNFIAIIRNQEDVPRMYQAIAKSAYASQPHAIPWEKEAYWAGHTEGMTAAALESCAAGTMWTDYEPTPMTREWLVENGFIAK